MKDSDSTVAGEEISAVLVAGGGRVIVPGGEAFLLAAEFMRSGPDLILIGPDGQQILIVGFFQGEATDLATESGAVIDSQLAAKLAGPLAPGQFAQAEGMDLLAPIGKVSIATGRVEVRRGDGSRAELNVGDDVYQDDVVITEQGGAVGLTFLDGTTFSLGSAGRMVLDEMVYDAGAQTGSASISVVSGSFTLVSGAIPKVMPDAMSLKTPAMTIGIRGTGVAGDGITVALMEERGGITGEITVTTPDGQTLTLNLPGAAATVGPGGLITTTLTPAQIGQLVGNALGALPNRENSLSQPYNDSVTQGEQPQQQPPPPAPPPEGPDNTGPPGEAAQAIMMAAVADARQAVSGMQQASNIAAAVATAVAETVKRQELNLVAQARAAEEAEAAARVGAWADIAEYWAGKADEAAELAKVSLTDAEAANNYAAQAAAAAAATTAARWAAAAELANYDPVEVIAVLAAAVELAVAKATLAQTDPENAVTHAADAAGAADAAFAAYDQAEIVAPRWGTLALTQETRASGAWTEAQKSSDFAKEIAESAADLSDTAATWLDASVISTRLTRESEENAAAILVTTRKAVYETALSEAEAKEQATYEPMIRQAGTAAARESRQMSFDSAYEAYERAHGEFAPTGLVLIADVTAATPLYDLNTWDEADRPAGEVINAYLSGAVSARIALDEAIAADDAALALVLTAQQAFEDATDAADDAADEYGAAVVALTAANGNLGSAEGAEIAAQMAAQVLAEAQMDNALADVRSALADAAAASQTAQSQADEASTTNSIGVADAALAAARDARDAASAARDQAQTALGDADSGATQALAKALANTLPGNGLFGSAQESVRVAALRAFETAQAQYNEVLAIKQETEKLAAEADSNFNLAQQSYNLLNIGAVAATDAADAAAAASAAALVRADTAVTDALALKNGAETLLANLTEKYLNDPGAASLLSSASQDVTRITSAHDAAVAARNLVIIQNNIAKDARTTANEAPTVEIAAEAALAGANAAKSASQAASSAAIQVSQASSFLVAARNSAAAYEVTAGRAADAAAAQAALEATTAAKAAADAAYNTALTAKNAATAALAEALLDRNAATAASARLDLNAATADPHSQTLAARASQQAIAAHKNAETLELIATNALNAAGLKQADMNKAISTLETAVASTLAANANKQATTSSLSMAVKAAEEAMTAATEAQRLAVTANSAATDSRTQALSTDGFRIAAENAEVAAQTAIAVRVQSDGAVGFATTAANGAKDAAAARGVAQAAAADAVTNYADTNHDLLQYRNIAADQLTIATNAVTAANTARLAAAAANTEAARLIAVADGAAGQLALSLAARAASASAQAQAAYNQALSDRAAVQAAYNTANDVYQNQGALVTTLLNQAIAAAAAAAVSQAKAEESLRIADLAEAAASSNLGAIPLAENVPAAIAGWVAAQRAKAYDAWDTANKSEAAVATAAGAADDARLAAASAVPGSSDGLTVDTAKIAADVATAQAAIAARQAQIAQAQAERAVQAAATAAELKSGYDSYVAEYNAQVAAQTIADAKLVLLADPVTATEDVAHDIYVLDNDRTADGAELVYAADGVGARITATGTPANGSVTIKTIEVDGVTTQYIQYTPKANFFGQDSFTYTVSNTVSANGVLTTHTATATVTVTVTAVNDAPVVTINTSPLAYVEGATIQVTPLLTVTDVDSANLSGATVTIGDFVEGEDVLSFTPQSPVSGSFNEQTGVLTLTGSASLAAYQAVLRSVTYSNSSNDPVTTNRTIEVTVFDGEDWSAAGSRTLTVTAINSPPVLTTPNLVVGEEDEVLALSAGAFTGAYSDPEGDALVSIRIESRPANGTLRLDGVDIAAGQVIAVADLGNLTFVPNADWFGSTSFSWRASDGTDWSDMATFPIQITPVNDAPVVSVAAAALAYTEDDGPVAVDAALVLTDIDSDTMTGATIAIAAGFVAAEDALGFTDQNGITGSFDAGTGILTLTGNASIAHYQAALRSVTYSNSSQDPDETPRTVTITVSDGELTSTVASRQIEVTSVNDAPVLGTPTLIMGTEDVVVSIPATTFTDVYSDPENDALVNIRIDTLAANGTLRLSGTAITAGQVIAAADLSNLTFVPDADWNGTTSFSWSASDGEDWSDPVSASITLDPVNDAPVLTGNAALPAIDEDPEILGGTPISTILAANFSDVDDGSTMSGIAVIANTADAVTEGVWRFFTEADWADIGPATEGGAVALSAGTMLMFVPVANYNGTPPGLVVRALDDTYAGEWSNSAGTIVTVDTTVNGGSTAISTGTSIIGITVNPTNDPPEFSAAVTMDPISNRTTDPAGATVAELFEPVFTDIDGDSLGGIAITAAYVTNGTWQYSTDDGGSWHGIGDIFQASAALALSASSMVRFVPNAGYSGDADDLFAVPVDDSYQGAWTSGGTRVTVDTLFFDPYSAIGSPSVQLSQTITLDNDAPVVAPITLSGTEDTTLTIGAAPFLGAYTDADSDALVSVEILTLATGGDLKLSGTVVTINQVITAADLPNLTFEPSPDWNGNTSFTWRAFDGFEWSASSTADISIAAVNDPPEVTSIQGSALLFDGDDDFVVPTTASTKFSGADSFSVVMDINPDPAGGTLWRQHAYAGQLEVVTEIHANGALSFAIGKQSTGWNWHTSAADIITFNEWSQVAFVKDGSTARIHVNGIEVFSQETGATQLSSTATTSVTRFGADGGANYYNGELSSLKVYNAALGAAALSDLAAGGTVSDNLMGDWRLDEGSGTTLIDSKGFMGNITLPGTITWTDRVSDVFRLLEDNIATGTVLVSDVDGDIVTGAIHAQAAHGIVAYDHGTGTWTYTPDPDYNGEDSFILRFDDGQGGITDQTISLLIHPVNDPPVISASVDFGTLSGASIFLATADLLANASDVDGDTLSVVDLSAAGDAGTFSPGTDGDGNPGFFFTPNAGVVGPVVINYGVSDGAAVTATTAHMTLHSLTASGITNADGMLAFDGVDDMASATVAMSAAAGTIELWVQKNWAAPNDQNIIGNDRSGDTAGAVYISDHHTAGLHFRYGGVGQDVGDIHLGYVGSRNWVEGSWHHVAATWEHEGGTTTLRLFIDGQQMTTVTTALQIDASALQNWVIGKDTYPGVAAAQDWLEGAVDNVRMWSVARTEAEIQSSFQLEEPATTTGLLAHWTMDAVENGVVPDANGGPALTLGSTDAVEAGDPLPVNVSSFAVGEGVTYTGQFLATDRDGQAITYSIQENATNGTLTLNPDGSYTYVPNTGYLGVDSFTLSAATGIETITHAVSVTVADTQSLHVVGVGDAGGVLAFDGAGLASTATDTVISTSVFSFEAWINPTSLDGTRTIVSKGSEFSLAIVDGEVQVSLVDHIGPGAQDFTLAVTIDDWSHVAVVCDGSAFQFYVNGELAGGGATHPLLFGDSAAPLVLGGKTSDANAGFIGQMDDVRLWDVARSTSEIQSSYQLQVPATTAGLVANWTMDAVVGNDVLAANSGGPVLTLTDARLIDIPPRSMTFDGVDDYVTLDGDFSIGTGALTFEAWINTSDTVNRQAIWSLGDEIGLSPRAAAYLYVQNGTVHFDLANQHGVDTGINVADGQWHHVAAVLNPSGHVTVYVDGNAVGSHSFDYHAGVEGGYYNITDGPAIIGATYSHGAYYFQGQIADARIWDIARTPADIAGGMNVRPATDEFGLLVSAPLDNLQTGGWTMTSGDISWVSTNVHGSPILTDTKPPSVTDTIQVREDTPFSGQLVIEGAYATLAIAEGGQPQYGKLMLNEDGTFSYRPDKDYAGADSFTIIVTNSNDFSVTKTFQVAVTEVDDPADLHPPPAHEHGALEFHGGAASYIAIDPALATGTSPLTIEAWVRTGSSATMGLVTLGDPDTNAAEARLMMHEGKLHFGFSHVAGVSSVSTIADNEWHHVAVTLSSNGEIVLYVDGIAETVHDFGVAYNLTQSLASIGNFAGGNYFNGAVSEVRIWTEERTTQQLVDGMVTPPEPTDPVLHAWWNFEEGSGTIVNDIAGGFTGTVMGNAHWTDDVYAVTLSDTTLAIDGTAIFDPDAAPNLPGTLRVVIEADNGVLTLGSVAGLTFIDGSANGTSMLAFTGSAADINAALALASYQPDAGFTGRDKISFLVDEMDATVTRMNGGVMAVLVLGGAIGGEIAAVDGTFAFTQAMAGDGGAYVILNDLVGDATLDMSTITDFGRTIEGIRRVGDNLEFSFTSGSILTIEDHFTTGQVEWMIDDIGTMRMAHGLTEEAGAHGWDHLFFGPATGATGDVIGGDGDDYLIWQGGGGSFDGAGGNYNGVSFINGTSGVVVNTALTASYNSVSWGQATIGGVTTYLKNVNEVDGTRYSDTMTGSVDHYNLEFRGYGGSDAFYGGGGETFVLYDWAQTGIALTAASSVMTVSYPAGTSYAAGTDTLTDILGVVGSDFADVLDARGSNQFHVLSGGAGDDILYAGAHGSELLGGAGRDIMHGGAGVDTFAWAYDDTGLNGDARETTDVIVGFDVTMDFIGLWNAPGISFSTEAAGYSVWATAAGVDDADTLLRVSLTESATSDFTIYVDDVHYLDWDASWFMGFHHHHQMVEFNEDGTTGTISGYWHDPITVDMVMGTIYDDYDSLMEFPTSLTNMIVSGDSGVTVIGNGLDNTISVYNNSFDAIHGGDGVDTLAFLGGPFLDLTGSTVTGIEIIDLSAAGSQTVAIDGLLAGSISDDINDATGVANSVVIMGLGDTVDLSSGGWTLDTTGVSIPADVGGSYSIYEHTGGAKVYVEAGNNVVGVMQ